MVANVKQFIHVLPPLLLSPYPLPHSFSSPSPNPLYPPLCWQYYDETFPTLKEQRKFEESLFQKTHRANGEPFPLSLTLSSSLLIFSFSLPLSPLLLSPSHFPLSPSLTLAPPLPPS